MTTPPPPGDQPYDPNQPQPGQVPPPPPPGGGGYTTPPQPGYGQQPPTGEQPGGFPPPGPPAQGSSTNTLGIVSLVVGILSIVLSFCCVGLILGPAAIVTGFLGMRNADQSGGQTGGRGIAMAGLICGAVGLIISLILTIIAVTAGNWNWNYSTS